MNRQAFLAKSPLFIALRIESTDVYSDEPTSIPTAIAAAVESVSMPFSKKPAQLPSTAYSIV